MEKTFKNYRAEIKSVDESKKTVTAIVSHAKKDRDGDIIPPEAFKKRLKRYKDHPVLLVNHDYRVENQIGKATAIKLNDDHVEATFEYFADLGNETANWAFELAKKGLASYSIGFQSFEFDWIEEKDERGEKRVTGRKFTDIELLEISQVVVPANPMALQRMFDLPETNADEKELCELVMKGITEGVIKAEIKDAPPESGTAEAAMVRDMAELKNLISQVQQQVAEGAGRLLQLEQKVQKLENIEAGEEIQTNAEEQAGGDKSYLDDALKLDGKTVKVGEGVVETRPTPDTKTVDVVLLVKSELNKLTKGSK